MSTFVGFSGGLYKRTIADVEKQSGGLLDKMKHLQVRLDGELATLAGYDDTSICKIKDLQDQDLVLQKMVKDGGRMLKDCIEQNDIIRDILEAPKDGHRSLLDSVEEQGKSVAQTAFDCILADPNLPVIMLRHWGPGWSRKIDEALERIAQPSQVPANTIQLLQSEMDIMRDANVQLKVDCSGLQGQLEATNSLVATQREEVESLKSQLEAAVSESGRLQRSNKFLAEYLAAFKEEAEQRQEVSSLLPTTYLLLAGLSSTVERHMEDWDPIVQSLHKWPAIVSAGSGSANWHWLECWSNYIAPVDALRGSNANQALVQVVFLLQDDELRSSVLKATSLLQGAISALANAADVLEGLCRLAVAKIMEQKGCDVRMSLFFCQVLQIISKKWPAIGGHPEEFVRERGSHLHADDVALIQAILNGSTGKEWEASPRCARATMNDRHFDVVVVGSISSFLCIDASRQQLRWIESDRTGREHIKYEAIVLKAPDGSCHADIHLRDPEVPVLMAVMQMTLDVAGTSE